MRPLNEPATPISIGRPTFPAVRPDMALADFVGTESWLIFDLIGADVSWVRRPPPWDGLQGYEDVKAVLLSLCGVNDPAERICALAKRYAVSFYYQILH